ncbi:hypothetical protein FIU97_15925 [Roseivivax sp. THAF40]|uniref:hypothetical protein n=1 Tax=unclassified Roseivivax TaxID=2639302 RepID=UPI001267B257|nr:MULTISPECIES: hypothetical protein [unclassified Roseivivax]QFS84243.1 hypothetical protein FIV09_15510 [Roseivivax sp. THAF197b]QFT48071.1 hypothetical protein FIU97_15925 [Roseivivax sp. THAF40]
MARRFITLVLAAATALSLLSTQARAASNEDIAKIAGGVALLLILGTAIDAAQEDDDDDKKKDKKKKQKQAEETAWYDHHAPFRPGVHKGYPGQVKNGSHYAPHHQHASPRTLPPQCRVRLPVAEDRKKGFYLSRCLKRTYPAFARLPAACNIKTRYNGRKIVGFWERCLDKRGYHTPRH